MTTYPQSEDSDIMVHAATYHRFMLAVKWFVIHFAAITAFLTLWFATPAGFVWALIAGLAIFGGGVYAMRHGLAHSSEGESLPGPGEGGR
jgi:hypothetical protein